MLMPFQKAVTIIALSLFFVVAVAGEVWQSSGYSQPPASHPPSQSIRSCNDQNVSHDSKRDCIDEAIANYTFWLVVVTFILAAATIGLGIGTVFQLRLARAEFISTHRPRLIVRQFNLDKPVLPDQIINVQYSIINIGDTNAILTAIAGEIALWDGFQWEERGIDPIAVAVPHQVIKNGERIHGTIQSRFKPTEKQAKAIELQDSTIYAAGELTYMDDLNTQRRTGFMRKHDFSHNRFSATETSDYEYQD
jgi:hypothetical protein